MQEKHALWLISAAAGLVTGAVSLYMNVRDAAVRVLDRNGAFDGAYRERNEAAAGARIDSRRNEAAYVSPETADARLWTQKQNIIREHGANRFGGAWKILPKRERKESVVFAAINGVLMGAMIYAFGRALRGGGDDRGRDDDPVPPAPDGGGMGLPLHRDKPAPVQPISPGPSQDVLHRVLDDAGHQL